MKAPPVGTASVQVREGATSPNGSHCLVFDVGPPSSSPFDDVPVHVRHRREAGVDAESALEDFVRGRDETPAEELLLIAWFWSLILHAGHGGSMEFDDSSDGWVPFTSMPK